MLDIDEEYLEAERSIEHDREDVLNTAMLLGGKDYLFDTLWSDITFAHNQNSAKSYGATGREMCSSTLMGLGFIYTHMVGGRTKENDLVKVLGGDGLEVKLSDFPRIPLPLLEPKSSCLVSFS